MTSANKIKTKKKHKNLRNHKTHKTYKHKCKVMRKTYTKYLTLAKDKRMDIQIDERPSDDGNDCFCAQRHAVINIKHR